MSTASPVPFDARPLTERLTRRRAVHVLAERRLPRPMKVGTRTIVILVEIAFVVLGIALIRILPSTDEEPFFIFGIVIALIALAFLAVTVGTSLRGRYVDEARLALFAEANAMEYEPFWGGNGHQGMIFTFGTAHTTRDVLRSTVPRVVEFGTHDYEPPDSESTVRWGYIAVQLDAPLPHIVLDSTANNRMGRSNLPLVFPDARELDLEGDFGRHFRLLCPPGYETDAYYLFTPDVMARLLDAGSQIDAEIVDDWLFFYIDGRRSTPVDPRQWAWMFTLVAAMLEKTDQWARWRDGHLADGTAPGSAPEAPAVPSVPVLPPPEGVADDGKRLRRRTRITIGSVIGGIVLIFFAVLRVLEWIG
ncbi:hypothetical protein [Microbacterium sp. gxy059]|uniref:hypothetical protein n=1 Tax=Microbacterium sp. gxy059 TaxID=2957199 RepID=UPI003D980671